MKPDRTCFFFVHAQIAEMSLKFVLAALFAATAYCLDSLSARTVVVLEARLNFSLWVTDLYYGANDETFDDEVVMVCLFYFIFQMVTIDLGVWQSILVPAHAHQAGRPICREEINTYRHCANHMS
jgi:hypothetical protein